MFSNLEFIKTNGITLFVDQQRIRMDILADFLTRNDDGRSKSFYCQSCALLPIDKLWDCHSFMASLDDLIDVKEKCQILKKRLEMIANDLNLDITLKRKKHHA